MALLQLVGDNDLDAEQPVRRARGDFGLEQVFLGVGGFLEFPKRDEIGAVYEPPVRGDLGGRRQRDRTEQRIGVNDIQLTGLHSRLIDQTRDAIGGFTFGPFDHSDGGRDASSEAAAGWRRLFSTTRMS